MNSLQRISLCTLNILLRYVWSSQLINLLGSPPKIVDYTWWWHIRIQYLIFCWIYCINGSKLQLHLYIVLHALNAWFELHPHKNFLFLKQWKHICNYLGRFHIEVFNFSWSLLFHRHLYFSQFIKFLNLLCHFVVNCGCFNQMSVIYPTLYITNEEQFLLMTLVLLLRSSPSPSR